MRIIRGKKAMVTGAASGIGRAIALELAKEGADLFLVDIKADALAVVAHEARGLGVNAMTAVADLADPSQISGTVEQLRNAWKRLNILVNNAGTTYYGQTHLMTGKQWRRIMAVNLMAPIQLVHELLPMLLAAEDAHILNVSAFSDWSPGARRQRTRPANSVWSVLPTRYAPNIPARISASRHFVRASCGHRYWRIARPTRPIER